MRDSQSRPGSDEEPLSGFLVEKHSARLCCFRAQPSSSVCAMWLAAGGSKLYLTPGFISVFGGAGLARSPSFVTSITETFPGRGKEQRPRFDDNIQTSALFFFSLVCAKLGAFMLASRRWRANGGWAAASA